MQYVSLSFLEAELLYSIYVIGFNILAGQHFSITSSPTSVNLSLLSMKVISHSIISGPPCCGYQHRTRLTGDLFGKIPV